MSSAVIHARRLIEQLPPAQRDGLLRDPSSVLASLGFTIRERSEADVPGDCSVVASLHPGPPPVITIVDSASSARRRFSLLHEFGHSLVAADEAVADLFFDQPDGGIQLEEQICDEIAGRLLLPDERVAEHIGQRGPTARSVLELLKANRQASAEACCVRAAGLLEGPGHVMLARGGVALFTAAHSTPFRVRRQTSQGDDHPIARAERNGSCRGRASVTYASGAPSPPFFVDAVADEDGLVLAVFAECSPAWETGLVLGDPDAEFAGAAEAYCPHCEVDFTTMAAPCAACNDYVHSGTDGCGRCSCAPARRGKTCPACHMWRVPAEWSLGGESCDECLGG